MPRTSLHAALLSLLALAALLAPAHAQPTAPASSPDSPRFAISPSGRHLTLGGKPFFWLGDTAWLLTQIPSREEAELYLRTRAEQGFTIIQLTAIMGEARVAGTRRPAPFINNDVARPAITPGADPADPAQYDHWDNLDFVLDRIHAHGMRPALVVYFVGWQGEGYKLLTPEKAYAYGRFLGERYRTKPDMIWVLGGDNTPGTDDRKSVWNRVARGIAEGLTGREDYSRPVMTYHINGGASSSQFWHTAPWLDFNMCQTWDQFANIQPMLQRDYRKTPIKPCGLGEGAYEDGPQYPTKPINALIIRRQACWSYFAGGYHTYGNGNVWHFDTVRNESTQPWKEALRSPGAEDLRHIKKFLLDIDWPKFIPDQSLFAEGQGEKSTLNVAMRTEANDAVAVYLSSPAPIKLRLDNIAPSSPLTARWTNPATGETRPAAAVNREAPAFTPPPGWEDALLHIHP